MFKSVVDFGGFNQASPHIHKSQSSIHNSVNKIEQTLGVRLFRVEGRRTILTDVGQLMLRRAELLLSEAEKLEALGLNLAKGVEPQLKVAVDEAFPQTLLYKVLDKVSAEFPFLQIELSETVLGGANELLDNSEVDIAISACSSNAGKHEELCQVSFIAVAHPEHDLHKLGRQLSLDDLKAFRQVVVRDSSSNGGHDEGWLDANERWTVSHVRTSMDIIRQGFGFGWLPIDLIEKEIKQGELKLLDLIQGGSRKVQLYVLFKDGDCLGPAAGTFLDELRHQTMKGPCCLNSLNSM